MGPMVFLKNALIISSFLAVDICLESPSSPCGLIELKHLLESKFMTKNAKMVLSISTGMGNFLKAKQVMLSWIANYGVSIVCHRA